MAPKETHTEQNTWHGLNVLQTHIEVNGKGWVCEECQRGLQAGRLPKFALNNNMWIGDPPLVLRKLTFAETLLIARHYARCYVFKLYPKDGSRGYNQAHLQRAMAGNVTLYDVNTSAVASMLEGNLLPQGVASLSSIVAITFIGAHIQSAAASSSRSFAVVAQAQYFVPRHRNITGVIGAFAGGQDSRIHRSCDSV